MSNKKLIYLTVTGGISIILSFFVWNSWWPSLTHPSLNGILTSVGFTIFWLTLVALFCLFNQNYPATFIFSLLSSLSVFSLGISRYTAAAGLLLFFALTWLSFSVIKNREKLIKASLPSLLSQMHTVLTLLALALTIIYFPVGSQKSQNFRIQIPEELFRSVLQGLVPENATDEDFLNQQFEAQIPRLKEELRQQGITKPQEVEQELARSRERFLEQTSQNTPVPGSLNPDDLKTVVEGQLNSLIKNYSSFLPLILTLSLYLTLTFFAAFTNILILFLAQVIIWILKEMGVVLVNKETVEVERLTIE